jgi:hypothetical protein
MVTEMTAKGARIDVITATRRAIDDQADLFASVKFTVALRK